jgi:DnaD/phage-associated family protein
MGKINFRVLLRPLSECQGFTEMTATELRVLVALIENGGTLESPAELARLSATTEARAISTLTLLSEMGLIAPEDEEILPRGSIVEEFEYRIREGEIEAQSSCEVAKTIRDGNLADMINECAALFEEPAISSEHTAILTALYTQYGLSPEYILTLASYMASKGKPNVSTLKNKAISLHKRGIDTVEELERYIADCERENTADWELKRLFGIKGRNLSDAELAYFRRWCDEFDFTTEIISSAYDICSVATGGKLSFPYMDKILTEWHDAGCKTLEECRLHEEKNKADRREAYKPKTKPREKEKPKPPRYGSFDVDEAFRAALKRSFSDDDGEND